MPDTSGLIHFVHHVLWSFIISAVVRLTFFMTSPIDAVQTMPEFFSPSADYLPLTNIVVDNSTGTLFVGAKNRIYQLNQNLSMVNEAVTGPVQDNPMCYSPITFGQNSTCSYLYSIQEIPTQKTDNYNQVVVVDAARNQVITCGSVFQGTCQTRNIRNVSQITANLASEVTQFVASSNLSVPTVAFVSPGPNNDDVLYVATVDLGPGADANGQVYNIFRKYTCGVSSRRLTNADSSNALLAPYQRRDQSAADVGTFVTFAKDAVLKQNIKYVSGFGFDGFSYFLSIQPAPAVSGGYVSRIAQVCQNDPNYNSFFDMNIQCIDGTKNFNIIQSTVVAKPGTLLANAISLNSSDYVMIAVFYSAPNSALCVYKMADVRRSFTNNLQMCFNASTVTLGMQYYSNGTVGSSSGTAINNNLSNRQCGSGTVYWVPLSYCGEGMVQSKSYSNFNYMGLTASPVSTFINTNLTTLTVTTIDNHTVVFVGTSDGRLLKIRLDSNVGVVYDNSTVSDNGTSFSGNLILSASQDFVYGLTTDKVLKIPVSSCDQYVTCSQCLETVDPYCGWCTLQARCTRRLQCDRWSSANQWQSKLTGSYNSCINITGVQPTSQTSIERPLNLTILTTNFPELDVDASVICVFGSTNLSSPAKFLSPGLLQCWAPANVSVVESPKDFATVNLTIRLLPSDVDILIWPFTIFNCSVHSKCSECTRSLWGCRWCVHDNRCIDGISTCSNVFISSDT